MLSSSNAVTTPSAVLPIERESGCVSCAASMRSSFTFRALVSVKTPSYQMRTYWPACTPPSTMSSAPSIRNTYSPPPAARRMNCPSEASSTTPSSFLAPSGSTVPALRVLYGPPSAGPGRMPAAPTPASGTALLSAPLHIFSSLLSNPHLQPFLPNLHGPRHTLSLYAKTAHDIPPPQYR